MFSKMFGLICSFFAKDKHDWLWRTRGSRHGQRVSAVQFKRRHIITPGKGCKVQAAITIRRPPMEQNPGLAVWPGDNVLSAGSYQSSREICCKQWCLRLDIRTEEVVCNGVTSGITTVVVGVG